MRRILQSLCLSLSLLISGCMQKEPVGGLPSEGKENHPSDRPRAKRTAPRTINPDILAQRAFVEAPSLKARVAAGELPPLSERLPEKPLVVAPMEAIGQYGGTIRRALTGDIIQFRGVRKTLSENLLGYERPLARSIQLNLAERYHLNEDGKTAFFTIRKGVRWSDGAPFTVADILFWYDDMTMDENARINPVPPDEWIVDGRPLKMTGIDAHTLEITSLKPMGRVLNALCSSVIAYPKHVLAQYHPHYNPKASYKDFRVRTTDARLVMEPGLPRLSAWIPKQWVRGQRLVYERNPYYWKVDTAGNQLPYADRLTFTIIQDPEVILLKLINSEIDLMGRYGAPDMFVTLKAEEPKGRIRIHHSELTDGPAFYLNWDAPNAALKNAFRILEVRIALSLAINREEISATLFAGKMDPCGCAFPPSSPYFSEQNYKKFSRFAPAKARALLDAAGYRDRDGDGYRELKDGRRFELTIDALANDASGRHVCELAAEYWTDIGIKVNLNPVLRDILWPRRLNGTFEVLYWGFESAVEPLGNLNIWAITSPTEPYWHRNASGEGPEWLREVTRLTQRATTTLDPEAVRETMTEVGNLYAENIPIIVLGLVPRVWAANTRLGNVPDAISADGIFGGWSRPVFHEQIFIRR